MDSNLLRDQLARLHEELKSMREIDSPSSQLLIDVQNDIKRLLEQPPASGLEPRPAHASLPERLENIAVQFEAAHPTLAASSRRLVDLLAKAGL